MSRIDPIDEFVLNHGNPNSAEYKSLVKVRIK